MDAFLSSHPPHTPKQLQKKLAEHLDPELLSSPHGGGEPFLESWKAVNLANEVFGYDGWSSDVVNLSTDYVEFDKAVQRYSAAVTATVKVTSAANGTSHSDIGFAVVDNATSKAQALEKAKREATNDALKHALRLFGNLLGNSLYDKDYVRHVSKTLGTKSRSEAAGPIAPVKPPQHSPWLDSEELEKLKVDNELAERLSSLIEDANSRVVPLTKMIRQHIEAMFARPDEERNEDELVSQVKPLLRQSEQLLHETEGAIRGADPDKRLSSKATRHTQDHTATPQEQRLAEALKILVEEVGGTTEWAKDKLDAFPKAKKDLGPLLDAMSQPLTQIVGGVALLLGGVLNIVGNLLNGLGLGGLLKGIVGGLGLDKLYGGLGFGKLFTF